MKGQFAASGLILALISGVALWAEAQTGAVKPTWPECIPALGNAVVKAQLEPEGGWTSVRTYFRKAGEGDFYFLEMRAAGPGRYFAVLPIPKAETKQVDLYVLVRNKEGQEARTDAATVGVASTCLVKLNPEQQAIAQNLVVGHTNPAQDNREVLGFRCEGISSRLTAEGKLMRDEVCRKVLAGQNKRKLLVPLAIGGAVVGGVVLLEDHEEASPSRP